MDHKLTEEGLGKPYSPYEDALATFGGHLRELPNDWKGDTYQNFVGAIQRLAELTVEAQKTGLLPMPPESKILPEKPQSQQELLRWLEHWQTEMEGEYMGQKGLAKMCKDLEAKAGDARTIQASEAPLKAEISVLSARIKILTGQGEVEERTRVYLEGKKIAKESKLQRNCRNLQKGRESLMNLAKNMGLYDALNGFEESTYSEAYDALESFSGTEEGKRWSQLREALENIYILQHLIAKGAPNDLELSRVKSAGGWAEAGVPSDNVWSKKTVGYDPISPTAYARSLEAYQVAQASLKVLHSKLLDTKADEAKPLNPDSIAMLAATTGKTSINWQGEEGVA